MPPSVFSASFSTAAIAAPEEEPAKIPSFFASSLDYLCQDKISTLQSENQALRLAASQSNQNAVLMAAMDANKADILRCTGVECPTAAYIVQPPTPVTFPTNCCGQATFGGNGCGNNCNNGCGF